MLVQFLPLLLLQTEVLCVSKTNQKVILFIQRLYFNGPKNSSFHFGDVLDSNGTLTFDLSNITFAEVCAALTVCLELDMVSFFHFFQWQHRFSTHYALCLAGQWMIHFPDPNRGQDGPLHRICIRSVDNMERPWFLHQSLLVQCPSAWLKLHEESHLAFKELTRCEKFYIIPINALPRLP